MAGAPIYAAVVAPRVPVVLQARALLILALAQVLLRRQGTAAALRLLARRRRNPRSLEPPVAMRAVRRAGRLTRGACLSQAVALTALLTRAGEDPTLVLGCRRYREGVWGAHAWVDLDGEQLEPVASEEHQLLATCRPEHDWVPTPPSAD